MAKGRIVLDVWKNHEADPFFWVELEGIKKGPFKVYYGREGWTVELHRQETRAIYVKDDVIKDPASHVAASIDISGPIDEILVLVEYAGYHGTYARIRPAYLRVPRRALEEVSEHLATLELLQELAKNDPTQASHFHTRSHPLERSTRYQNQAYPRRWGVVTGRHHVLDTVVQRASLPAVSLPETTER